MSTPKIAERIVKEVQAGTYDFIASNFANADMVGHTGKYAATKLGAEAIDRSRISPPPTWVRAGDCGGEPGAARVCRSQHNGATR